MIRIDDKCTWNGMIYLFMRLCVRYISAVIRVWIYFQHAFACIHWGQCTHVYTHKQIDSCETTNSYSGMTITLHKCLYSFSFTRTHTNANLRANENLSSFTLHGLSVLWFATWAANILYLFIRYFFGHNIDVCVFVCRSLTLSVCMCVFVLLTFALLYLSFSFGFVYSFWK